MDKAPIERLLDIMTQLRDPQTGCPWDVQQDFRSISAYTIEEAYEVADAIERASMPDLLDELGDLLFQVVFHAQMASEAGHFAFDDVANAISDKMVRRHPHVFAQAAVGDAESQTVSWEAIKAEERAGAATGDTPLGALDGVPVTLPGISRAFKLQKRAARVGFDWSNVAEVIAKLREETAELETEVASDGGPERLEDELGDLLFSVVNVARHLKVDPETAARRANSKFEARFRAMEAIARGKGLVLDGMTEQQLDELWVEAKAAVLAVGGPAVNGGA